MASAKQLIFDLLARDKTGPGTKGAADNLQDVGDAADDAARQTEKLGRESEKADGKVGDLGDSARGASRHIEKLDREIESVERELHKMAIAFAEAETAADRLDISRAIRRTEGDLKRLNKSKGLLSGVLPKPAELAKAGSQAGAATGTSFLESFSQAATKAGPLALVGAGMAIGIAPLLGATVAAGLVGGAAGGGIIGGLMLAKRDARVQSAAKSLGEDVLGSLGDAGGVWVGTTLDAIEQIRGQWKDMSGDVNSLLKSAARYVKPLVTGIGGFISQVVNGAEKAVAKAGPLFEVLRTRLPDLGAAIGDIFASLADNGPEIATAMEQIFNVIIGGTQAIGGTINGLTELYGQLAKYGILGAEAQKNWWAYKLSAESATGAQKDLSLATVKVTDAVEAQKRATKELDDMLRASVDPLFAFTKAQTEVSTAQTKYNEAVKKFGPNSREAAAAAAELADATIDLRNRANEAGAAADGKLTPAMRNALQAAGLTKAQIAGVERALAGARKEMDKYDGKTATAKVELQTAEAQARLKRLKTAYDALRSKQITVDVFVSRSVQEKVYRQGGDRMLRAAGGPVSAGNAYIVGEKRPEVFVPNQSGTIIPSVSQFLGGTGGSGGTAAVGGGTVITLDPAGAHDKLAQLVLSMFRVRPAMASELKSILAKAPG